MSSQQIESFTSAGALLAQVMRASHLPSETDFVTPPEANFQVGHVIKPFGTDVPRHRHHSIVRQVVGTSEVLVVQKGRAELDLYSGTGELVATTEVSVGDVIVLHDGGHGLRVKDDLVLLEIKQGPYAGRDEKELF